MVILIHRNASSGYSAMATDTETMELEALTQDETIDYAREIETVIASLATDQKVKFGHDEGGNYRWKFCYGTVDVFVLLTGQTDEDTFTVWSPVLQLPAQNETQLMRLLLEMNWGATFEARYAIADDRVLVLSSRTVADLSPEEISRAITIVATIADEQDEPLQEQFGA